MDLNNGLLAEARFVPSPNYDDRPEEEGINLVVIHGISLPPGEFGGNWIDDFFSNQLDPDAHEYFREIGDIQVSSHLLIRRDGEIVQYVPFNKRAWHAGQSSFDGHERCNDFSIGIELEGTDDIPYEYVQYEKLAQVITELKQAYPDISNERIVGHSDIAPGRKTDPGPAFDWQHLFQQMV
ncbi:MAG: 1,6-anhydro-N-acetylmuramyl-L-alanine amidase AmpD [Gammaproteobacteria bacterium]|nr:1,6-anhydro-N-acetylmuramyl-L-alanine amidase AmpD [Gammaproteobacteria bacterium]